MIWYIIIILSFSCQHDNLGIVAYPPDPYRCTSPSQKVLFAKNLDEVLKITVDNLDEEVKIYKCDEKECKQIEYTVRREVDLKEGG